MMKLFEYDATFYAQQIQQGKLTASDLVTWALSNIIELNPILRAVSVIQAEQALAEAKAFDQAFSQLNATQRADLPPFAGVPILLKDLGQEQAGVRSTNGARLCQDYIADTTDAYVQAVQALGFIIVGRTNTPEFGFKNVSDSELNGTVVNPLDLTRHAGGSSGGAAAALKAGIVPLVAASDGGGSIRIPASFAGVIGLKPSRGRIPVGPTNYRGWQGAAVNFALTKSMRDTWQLLLGLQTTQYDAPFTLPQLANEPLEVPKRSLKIGYMADSDLIEQVSSTATDLMQEVVAQLRQLGHIVSEVIVPVDMVQAARDYGMMNGVETVAMMQRFEATLQRPVTELDMELTAWAIYQVGLPWSAADYSQLLNRWDQLSATLEAVFNEYDVIITPGANGVAPLLSDLVLSDELVQQLRNQSDLTGEQRLDLLMEMWREGWSLTPYTFIQNLAGQPAITVPYVSGYGGLPLGVQLWSGKGQEDVICQLAYQLEQEGCLDSTIVQRLDTHN